MDETFSRLREVLARHAELKLAIVFGSVATRAERPDSDLDIAILGRGPLTAEQRMGLMTELAEAVGRAIDLVDLATVGEPLLGEILAGGRRLIGSDEAYAALLCRHLLDQADFLPYRNRILAERRRAWIGK